MNACQIESELMKYISERFEIEAEDSDFSASVNLFNYGYIDSFGSVEMYAHVESQYEVSISQEDLLKTPLRSVSEMVEFVLSRKEVRS